MPLAAGAESDVPGLSHGGGGVLVKARATCYRGRTCWLAPVEFELPYDLLCSIYPGRTLTISGRGERQTRAI